MSQQLIQFIEKLKREVQPGVPMARRVRLMTAGESNVWETWEPISEVDSQQWATDAEALIAGLAIELPKRRVQLAFIAEDASGATVTTLTRTITGQNANAQDLGTQNGAKALADAMTAVGKLQEATLEQARKMLDFQAQQLEKAQAYVDNAHEFFMAIRKAELETTEQESAASRLIGQQLEQAAPMVMTMLQHIVTNSLSGNKGLSGTAAAAVNATGAKAS